MKLFVGLDRSFLAKLFDLYSAQSLCSSGTLIVSAQVQF